jgi:hypothetical protein
LPPASQGELNSPLDTSALDPVTPHKRPMKALKWMTRKNSNFAMHYFFTSDILIFQFVCCFQSFQLPLSLSFILFAFSSLLSINVSYGVPDKIPTPEIFSCAVCLPEKLLAVGLFLLCWCEK